MRKSVIFLTLLLLASIAGTYAVYKLYVKERMRELGEHLEEEKRLRERVGVLETTFFKTEPQVVLDAWRRATQPWSDAVGNRARYFTLGPLMKEVELPREIIPKVYYEDELPKLIKSLEDYAAEKDVIIGDANCGVPGATAFGQGANPKRPEIKEHLEKYEYCSALTRMLIDAKPVRLEPLQIWQEEEIQIRSGFIKKRTTGISMQMRTRNLVEFLDSLSQDDRYFRIEELKIYNQTLNEPDPLLTVELVLSQAYYAPSTSAAEADSATPVQANDMNRKLTSLFGGNAEAAPRAVRDEPTWWQRFRRTWIPF